QKIIAIRDANNDQEEGYKQFVELFGLKVNNNRDDGCNAPGTGETERKERYEQNDIIYGETGYFQRDILLIKFFGKKIRDRIGDSLTVDEVDNKVIDNAEKTLYISHSITGMRHLRDLFIQVWVAVNNEIEQHYSEEKADKIYEYTQMMTNQPEMPKKQRTFLVNVQ
ncbi:unnamed protein product, partial [Didymodactylos carnosus]